jgi:hypothetical protein
MKSKDSRTMDGTRGGAMMKLLLFIVIFCGVLSAAWIYFLPVILTSTLEKHTGFGVKVTQMSFNPFNAKVDLSGFILTNPPGFPRRDFMEITSFNANAKLKTLFSDRPEFDYARVEVAYVAMVRNSEGVLNVQLFRDRLNPPKPANDDGAESGKSKKFVPDAKATQGGPVNKPLADKKAGAKDTKDSATAKDPKAKTKESAVAAKDQAAKDQAAKDTEAEPVERLMPFLIRRLELRLDKVIIADYAAATPVIREYNCKLVYAFNDVSDPKQLLAPFAFKSLETVGMAIKGLIPGDIGKTMNAATRSEDPMIKKDSGAPGEDPLKSVVEKLEETQKP